MKKKKELKEPGLVPCKTCKQTGKCTACGGKGIQQKYAPRILLNDKMLTIACKACGDGEVIGQDGYVYPASGNKKGSGKCQDCNGVAWVVERIDLKMAK